MHRNIRESALARFSWISVIGQRVTITIQNSSEPAKANKTLLMDIAFDEEPTGTAGTSEGFGFGAESSVGGDMGFGDSSSGLGDDLGLGGFTDAPAQAPAPEFFDQPAAQSYSPPAPVAAAPAPVASMFAAPEAENPLTIWEAQHKTHLKEKAEKEKINNDKMRKDADAWLKQFSDERKKNHDVKHKDNQCANFFLCAFTFSLALPSVIQTFPADMIVIILCEELSYYVLSGLTRPHLSKRWRKFIRRVLLGRA
jgi:hypothetical protein